jgi:hypothetical protein
MYLPLRSIGVGVDRLCADSSSSKRSSPLDELVEEEGKSSIGYPGDTVPIDGDDIKGES